MYHVVLTHMVWAIWYGPYQWYPPIHHVVPWYYDPLLPRSGEPFTLYRWIVDQYDQQLAALLASHHYHLTDRHNTAAAV